MAGKAAKKTAKKKPANSYKMPEPIPKGEVLTDVRKQKWIIGPSIGVGGFGEIYSAASYSGGTPKDYPLVVKIEPHGNGPLFVEMHFYMRNAQVDDIETWKKKKKLRTLGMPRFISSGSHECHNSKYRFVVMDKYGKNLWDIFLKNNRKFPEPTVYKVALQIMNVLEYIHDKGYVHADVKGANLLLSLKSSDQVFLVDFGLASHYTTQTEYKPDPKKAHNGTIEYTSRDAHMGIPTMRGDMEILAYNMVQWLSSSLPWEKSLTDPKIVQNQKENAFADKNKFLEKCFPNGVPDAMDKFFKLLSTMKFNETPNYDKFKDILVEGIKECGEEPEGKLDFVNKDKSMKTPTKAADVSIGHTRQSLRLQNVLSPNSTADELNDSGNLGSIIINKRTKSSTKNRILKNVEVTDDSDMEIEIKITKKRKNRPDVVKKTVVKKTPKKVTKESQNVVPNYNLDETVSDDATQVPVLGTRSRPKVTTKRKTTRPQSPKKLDAANDSTEDIFDDSYHDDNPTPPKLSKKSWKDMPSVKNGRVTKPGQYKRGAQTGKSKK